MLTTLLSSSSGGLSIVCNRLNSTVAFYPASVGQVISTNLLSSSAQIYSHTVAPGAAFINTGTPSSSATFFNATVTGSNSITASLLSSTAQLYNPTVTTSNTINTDFVLSTAQFYSHTVTAVSPITCQLLSQTTSFPAASLSYWGEPQTISANLLSNTNLIFDASVAQQQTGGSGLLLLGVG